MHCALSGRRELDMIGYYNYTVILTYLGFLSSMFGLASALSGRPAVAVVCMLISGIADMFDGPVARHKTDRTPEECRFGIQIDSISDMLCFGVLPSVIGYSIGLDSWYWMIALGAYSLAALIRLAYFNVTEEIRQSETTETRKSYLGMPVTTSAYTFPILYLFKRIIGEAFPYVYGALIVVSAVLFIAPVRVKKPGKKFRRAAAVLGVFVIVLLFAVIRRRTQL